LNERNCQQQEDEKIKKSLALSIPVAVSNGKETSDSSMPNHYVRVKNIAKGEDVIKDNKDQTYAFDNEFLEEAIKSSSIA
jgi:hypothetical protein